MILSAFNTNEKDLAVASWKFMKENFVELKRPENWKDLDNNEMIMAMKYESTNREEILGFIVDLALAPQFSLVSNPY